MQSFMDMYLYALESDANVYVYYTTNPISNSGATPVFYQLGTPTIFPHMRDDQN